MNKQIVFLSFFSIILLAAVYYVTSPIEENVGNTIEIDELESACSAEIHNLKNQNNNILASSSASSLQKRNALNQINEIQNNEKLSNNIKEKLVNNGYENSICIKNKKITVHIKNVEKDDKVAVDIFKLIFEEADHSFDIELLFKLQ